MQKIRAPHILLVLILGVSLSIPCSVSAYPQERPERNHSFMLGRMLDFFNFIARLDLTAEQKATLKELITNTGDAIKPLFEEMRELRDQMDEAILAETIDSTAAIELNQKIINLKSEISTTLLNAKLEGAQLLTPEQRAIILEKKKEHRERMEDWRERFKKWRDFSSNLILN